MKYLPDVTNDDVSTAAITNAFFKIYEQNADPSKNNTPFCTYLRYGAVGEDTHLECLYRLAFQTGAILGKFKIRKDYEGVFSYEHLNESETALPAHILHYITGDEKRADLLYTQYLTPNLEWLIVQYLMNEELLDHGE